MTEDLAARLSYETYLGDPSVRVGVSGRVGHPEVETWVPERLFVRLLAYGQAYQLHTLQLVSSQADSTLNSLQCRGLLDELDLVIEVAQDPALLQVARSIRDLAALIAGRPQSTLEFAPN